MERSERRTAWLAGMAVLVLLVAGVLVLDARGTSQVALAPASADAATARSEAPSDGPTDEPTDAAPPVLPVPTVPAILVPEGATAPPPPVEPAAPQPTTATIATPVPAHRAAVVIDVEPDEEAAARAAAAGLEGVVRLAGITVTTTTLGGVPADVAQVDPQEFRAFTPEATGSSQPLWDRIAAGDVAVTHEFGTGHDVVLGTNLEAGEAGPLRIGAFATNGTPPVADAIVRQGTPVGPGARRVLVALEEAASPTATAEALQDAGFAAEVVPDPRAPRDDIVIPTGGITPENVWDHLAVCESSGDWQINTGNGYYGGVQFLPESWAMVGGTGLPHEHPREEQIHRAILLWQIQGWEAWPQCARKLGLIVDQPTPGPTAGE